MDWSKLLNTKRVRQLYEDSPATKLPEDSRTEFERDYGRAVFSTPVRRLQDKAQVFPLERHDAIRTRLTHSNEVSSVARNLAGAAARWMRSEGFLKQDGQTAEIETIAATCGLIHDLGNPPFGHAGEVAIHDWFKDKLKEDPKFFDEFGSGSLNGPDTQEGQDFLRFEGNAQTQRLLSKLQVLADQFGLNLTCGTLSASCKYVARSHELDEDRHEFSKPGFFASEDDLISRIRKETGTDAARNPIAYLVEASDDIVYSTVDLEDGIKKGVLSWQVLEEEVQQLCTGDSELVQRAIKRAHEKIRPAGLSGKEYDEAMAQAFRTFSITEMVKAAIESYKHHYSEIMNGTYHREILEDSVAASFVAACKKIGRNRVYVSKETLKLELFGNRVIRELLSLFWSAARNFSAGAKLTNFNAKMYQMASPNYRSVFEGELALLKELNKPDLYVRLQLVTDQVSGMTDTFACDFYRELTNG